MKKLLAIFLVIILAVSVSACSADTSSSPDSSDTSAGKEVYKVGFTVQDLTIPYWVTLIKGIKDREDQYGIKVVVHDAKSDASSQITAMEDYIAQGVDCIVACPIDPATPENGVKEAHDAGIPVISWSEFIKGSDGFITINQFDYGHTAGTIAGNWIKEHFENEAEAKVMFVYVPDVAALAERGAGLKAGVLDVVPNATIISEQAGNTPEAGMKAVETVLTKYPDMNVIVCTNDASGLGAYEAMAAAGKKTGDVCIVGCDADAEAIKKIGEDSMYVGTVDVGTYDQGITFLDMCKKVIEEGPQKDPLYVNFQPVTKENVSKFLPK